MERTRLLWLILTRFDLFRPGLRVLHIAPELALAKRYSELCGDRYHACDIDPSRYSSRFTQVRPLDLCSDLVKLPSRSFDVIIHNHVLEHLRCDVEPVLEELERILAPGGHHFFSTPVSGELTREDLSDNLTPQHRLLLFGQADHYRVFGSVSLAEMLGRVWRADSGFIVEPLELFSSQELTEAAIPPVAWTGMSSHSIFHHVRPRHAMVAMAPTKPQAITEPPRLASQAFAGRRLFLHIGMPKTGTSSIQRWLFSHRTANQSAGLRYWEAAENHSELMFTCFALPERIARQKMWFQRGAPAEVEAARQAKRMAARANLDEFIARASGHAGLISGEAMWSFGRAEVLELTAHLRKRDVDTTVLCWIRPPAEYLASAAQQRCKSSLSITELLTALEKEVPLNYARLDSWIEGFGPDRVIIRPHVDDVIGDFQLTLSSLGIPLSQTNDNRPVLNPSMSLIAAKALLSLNEQIRSTPGRAQSKTLIEVLQAIDGESFRLPETLLRRLSPRLAREVQYLERYFDVATGRFAGPFTGIDDTAFLKWEPAEVGFLLAALNDALVEIETTVSQTIPRQQAPRRRPPSPGEGEPNSDARPGSQSRARPQRL
jgi:SAM-dependent methyltransferase